LWIPQVHLFTDVTSGADVAQRKLMPDCQALNLKKVREREDRQKEKERNNPRVGISKCRKKEGRAKKEDL
jgi:hypothetical protein